MEFSYKSLKINYIYKSLQLIELMKIIIAGAGEVGFHLAKLLSYESQEITLIEPNKENLAYADNQLDIKIIRGDATSIASLKEAKVHNSDLLIAVTSSEPTTPKGPLRVSRTPNILIRKRNWDL
jgi:alanine dehydrogenase